MLYLEKNYIKINMSPTLKGLFKLFNLGNKKDKLKDTFYKYDKIIDDKIILLNTDSVIDKIKIGNFNVKRNIPNKKELSKIYNKFIKKINNIDSSNDNVIFNYNNNILKIKLMDDNQYLLYKFNLNDSKKYNLSLTFTVEEKTKINFILINNYERKIYKLDNEVMGNIVFKTNNMILKDNYLEFYVIFSTQKSININNINIEINEIITIFEYNITLFKNNNKIIIF